jgi:hypothetical protein
MTIPNLEPQHARPLPQGNWSYAYYQQQDKYPSLGWGFLLYAVRWHFNRMYQREMAEITGYRQEYISRMELGKTSVPPRLRTWIMVQLERHLNPENNLKLAKVKTDRHERQLQFLTVRDGRAGGYGKKRKGA